MIIFLFKDKCFKSFNSEAVEFSDGLYSLDKLLYEDKIVSSNLVFIKSKFSLYRFTCFTSRNSKNTLEEYSSKNTLQEVLDKAIGRWNQSKGENNEHLRKG